MKFLYSYIRILNAVLPNQTCEMYLVFHGFQVQLGQGLIYNIVFFGLIFSNPKQKRKTTSTANSKCS